MSNWNMGISSSGEKTSSGVVTTANKAGLLYGYTFKVGTTASSIKFNNGGSSGTILVHDFNVAVTAAGDVTRTVSFPTPIVFSTDIYVTLAGTGATVIAYYKEIGK